MGITADGARFLASAQRQGVDFDTTLTLGRQELFARERDLRPLGLTGRGRFAEDAFHQLGATTVDAMDASPFEKAAVIHDLNEAIDPSLHGRYSTVLDGGTLEHVFNFPVALANAMQMVRPGGHLLLMTPANQHLGHGFYQFSPELFFRALSPASGYEVERLLLKDSRLGSRWWQVIDPVEVGGRATLLTSRVTSMYVQARRISEIEPFATPPQQSDYVARWEGDDGQRRRALWRRAASSLAVRSRLSRLSERIDPTIGLTGWDERLPDHRYFRPVELS